MISQVCLFLCLGFCYGAIMFLAYVPIMDSVLLCIYEPVIVSTNIIKLFPYDCDSRHMSKN